MEEILCGALYTIWMPCQKILAAFNYSAIIVYEMINVSNTT